MEELTLHVKNGNLYHAYCIPGRGGDILPGLKAFLEKELGLATVGNPDFRHISVESFGIDDSRRVKEMHTTLPLAEGGRKVFIIETNAVTNEAQNSLLKILEEPQSGTHFFIIVPTAEMFLPTIRSRVMIIRDVGGNQASSRNEGGIRAEAFLAMPMKDRIAFVDDLAADISDEKAAKQDAVCFLNDLESLLSRNIAELDTAAKRQSVEAVIRARDYIRDRSPSVKQLLEYVALSV
ncbi:MAG: polymerase subunit delta, polymerase subunit delta protein [Candidatus Taylorbacteria bacterium]|nr:polymerase subunit delta, polymerase subunit delta protein [Candidatus Taylorbacteria bacterium]